MRIVMLRSIALPGLVLFVLLSAMPVFAQPPNPALDRDRVSRAQEWVKVILFELDQLNNDIGTAVKQPGVERVLEQQWHEAFGAAHSLQSRLHGSSNREEIASRFRQFERKLVEFLDRIATLPPQYASIHQGARRLAFANDRLRAFSGDSTGEFMMPALRGQAKELTRVAAELQEATLGINLRREGTQRLQEEAARFSDAARNFYVHLQKSENLNDLRRAYKNVSQAWAMLAGHLAQVPPRLNYSLRTRAERARQAQEDLAAALKLEVPKAVMLFNPESPEERVLEKMEGVWFLQSQRLNGQFVQGQNKDQLFTISGNRFFTQHDGKPGAIGTIRVVDPLSNPLKIDFIGDGGTNLTSIVQLEDNVMRYCGAENGVRPTEFVTRPGDGRALSIWRRIYLGK